MANTVKKLEMPDGTIYELADGVAQNEIASLKTQMNNKSDINHNHDSDYDAKGAANTALNSAKSYADGIKNELLNGAGAAYDTLKELGDLIDDNTDAIEALETIASSKADASALSNYLPLTGGTMTGELVVNGGDAAGSSKIVLATGEGQITNSGTQTLFGFLDESTLAVGHGTYTLAMRGQATRPTYNGNAMALMSDLSGASDTKVTQNYSTANGSYPLLMTATNGNASTASRGATTSILSNKIYANPSTGMLRATNVVGDNIEASRIDAINGMFVSDTYNTFFGDYSSMPDDVSFSSCEGFPVLQSTNSTPGIIMKESLNGTDSLYEFPTNNQVNTVVSTVGTVGQYIRVVENLPASPDANTLYFIK